MSKLVTTDPSGTQTKTKTEVVTLTETITVKESNNGPWIIMLGVSIVLLILLVIICVYASNLHFKKHEGRPLHQQEEDERRKTDLVPNTEMEMGQRSPLNITPPSGSFLDRKLGNNRQGEIPFGSDQHRYEHSNSEGNDYDSIVNQWGNQIMHGEPTGASQVARALEPGMITPKGPVPKPAPNIDQLLLNNLRKLR